jgi:hypothetical protein
MPKSGSHRGGRGANRLLGLIFSARNGRVHVGVCHWNSKTAQVAQTRKKTLIRLN